MKFELFGKEFDSQEIEYIKHTRKKNKNGKKAWYVVVSQNGKEEIIPESETFDELKFGQQYYYFIEKNQEKLGFVRAESYYGRAFVNLKNAGSLKLLETDFLKRKYLVAHFKNWMGDENARVFKTKTVSKKNDMWDKMLNEFENKKASRFIAKYMKDYDLVKYLTAKRVQNNEYTIDKEVLKRALYTLRNDFVDQTEFCVSKSIDGAYNSIGIDDAFFNLLTFGVLRRVIPSHNEEYFIALNEKESNEILKPLTNQENEVINKVYSMYKDTEKEKNKEELFKNMGEAMVEIYGPKVPEKIKIIKADDIEEEPEPGQK